MFQVVEVLAFVHANKSWDHKPADDVHPASGEALESPANTLREL